MSLLIQDVSVHFVKLRRAYSKGSVTGLPREGGKPRECLVNPTGRIRLDGTENIGQGLVLPKPCEDVDMVRRTIDNKCATTFVSNSAPHIRA